jgi:hypothetical protein
MLRRLAGAMTAALLTMTSSGAATIDQTAAIQIFETPHMDMVPRGNRVNYAFKRTVSMPEYPSPGFDDKIHLDVTKVETDGKRNVALQVFSGERAKALWEETGMTGNPLLGWYLDNCVNQYRSVAGGDRDYLKNVFKIGLREKAKREDVKADWGGKQIDAVRVTVAPYADARDKTKMRGYEKSSFSLLFSPSVPGYFMEMTSNLETAERGSPSISEKISLVGIGEQGQ